MAPLVGKVSTLLLKYDIQEAFAARKFKCLSTKLAVCSDTI